jgi:histidyl-tRNA synthetase
VTMKVLLEPADILRRTHAVGTYYGFSPLSSLLVKTRGAGAKAVALPEAALDALDPAGRDVAGILKRLTAAGHVPVPGRPLFLWHTNLTPGRPVPKNVTIQFHALGTDRAIADAVLIRAVRSLVADLTKEEPVVRINSMGDKETRARLVRELGNYFRRRVATLSEDCAACARTDVLKAAEMLLERSEHEGLPSPTDHLSENSRKHFESVLEYLESTETPYELAPHLLSKAGTWSETCFEVLGSDEVKAWGSRYTDLAKLFFKGGAPSVGAVIRIALDKASEAPAPIRERKHPLFVFVHIGDEAKRESIKLTDVLRRARVPLAQAIGIESLTEQMRFADEQNPRFLLIMGRKEALERSVILRERATHTETMIPLDALVDQLKAVA